MGFQKGIDPKNTIYILKKRMIKYPQLRMAEKDDVKNGVKNLLFLLNPDNEA